MDMLIHAVSAAQTLVVVSPLLVRFISKVSPLLVSESFIRQKTDLPISNKYTQECPG